MKFKLFHLKIILIIFLFISFGYIKSKDTEEERLKKIKEKYNKVASKRNVSNRNSDYHYYQLPYAKVTLDVFPNTLKSSNFNLWDKMDIHVDDFKSVRIEDSAAAEPELVPVIGISGASQPDCIYPIENILYIKQFKDRSRSVTGANGYREDRVIGIDINLEFVGDLHHKCEIHNYTREISKKYKGYVGQ